MRATRASSAIAAAAVAILATSALTAYAVAGDGTNDPPPKIAFVAHGINPADALAAGPIVAQVGGVLCTTSPNALSEGAEACLTEFAPEMVIVVGGTAAIPDAIVAEIKTATGLGDDDIKRAAGKDRYKTAQEIGSLLDDLGLNVAFLPVDGTSADSAALDGLDAKHYSQERMVTHHGPTGFRLDGNSTSAIVSPFGLWAAVRAQVAGVKLVDISLDRPSQIGPNTGSVINEVLDYGTLVELEICYEVENSDDKISNVLLYQGGPAPSEVAAIGPLTLDNTEPTCHPIPLPEGGVEARDRALTLQLYYDADGTGTDRELLLYEVKATWDVWEQSPGLSS